MSDDDDDDFGGEWNDIGERLRRKDPRLAKEIKAGLRRLVDTADELAELAEQAFEPSPPRRVSKPSSPPRPARPVSRSTPSHS